MSSKSFLLCSLLFYFSKFSGLERIFIILFNKKGGRIREFSKSKADFTKRMNIFKVFSILIVNSEK